MDPLETVHMGTVSDQRFGGCGGKKGKKLNYLNYGGKDCWKMGISLKMSKGFWKKESDS